MRRVMVVAGLMAAGLVSVGVPPATAKPACKSTSTHAVHSVPTSQKLIALTFDDGPASSTKKLVATLDKYGAKVTFFMIGVQAKRNPALVRLVAEHGHEVANHSYGHQLGRPALVTSQIDLSQQTLVDAIGVAPRVFRAPGGCLTEAMDAALTRRGLVPVQWSVSSGDAVPRPPSAGAICSKVVGAARPGAIVLLHERAPSGPTMLAVPCILQGLAAKGYRTVTVSELLAAAGS